MYNTHHIFYVLPIKHLINRDGETTALHKLLTGTKPSVSNIEILFCLYVLQKAAAHVDGKALNICHQPQKCFQGISVGITQHQKGYLTYVPIPHKIVSSHDVVFDKTFSSTLAYTLPPYSEALVT